MMHFQELPLSRSLTRGNYSARLAETADEVAEAQALRHLCFRSSRGIGLAGGTDRDRFDDACRHLLVHELASGRLVSCCRLLFLPNGRAIDQSYSAQFYDLSRLSGFGGRMLELGRFCVHPDTHDPDILRLAWGALTRMVDETEVALLFGCTSLAGADPGAHRAALVTLAANHPAPPEWRPARASAEVIDLQPVTARLPASGTGMQALPQLLRSYLAMGGWVSDHAVIDRDLDTLHVFTALEIARVSAARSRSLRAVADNLA